MFKWDQVSTNQTIPAPRTGLFGCVCVSGKFVLICQLLSLETEILSSSVGRAVVVFAEGALQEACKSSSSPNEKHCRCFPMCACRQAIK